MLAPHQSDLLAREKHEDDGPAQRKITDDAGHLENARHPGSVVIGTRRPDGHSARGLRIVVGAYDDVLVGRRCARLHEDDVALCAARGVACEGVEVGLVVAELHDPAHQGLPDPVVLRRSASPCPVAGQRIDRGPDALT
jgi:hypothetical protein